MRLEGLSTSRKIHTQTPSVPTDPQKNQLLIEVQFPETSRSGRHVSLQETVKASEHPLLGTGSSLSNVFTMNGVRLRGPFV